MNPQLQPFPPEQAPPALDLHAALSALVNLFTSGTPCRLVLEVGGPSASTRQPDGSSPPTPSALVPADLSNREIAVLGVLAKASEPLKGRTVANRAGIRYTSHFREMMSGLVGRGLVIVGPEGGYWSKGRRLPEAPR